MNAPEPEGDPKQTPTKRPFARGTGFVYQSTGFLLTISTCCVWPAAHWWQGYQAVEDAAAVADPVGSADPAERWAMGGVAASFLGGLGLVVVGLGLQHDRLRTGRAPMVVTGIIASYFVVYLIVAAVQFPLMGRLVMLGGLATLWVGMFILAGVSADELRRHPPTPSERGWTSIDEDELRTIASLRSRDRTSR